MSPAMGLLALIVLGLAALMLTPKKLFSGSGGAPSGSGKYPYSELFEYWAAKYKTDPDLCAAHAKTESSFNPLAINEEDPKIDYDSSYGIMQVQLATAQDFGAVKDYRNATAAEIAWLMDINNNIKVGCWNVARWQKKYPFETAVQMYNVGERGFNVLGRRNETYLQKVREAYNGYHTA
jgi:soluble lytic murein transglycosylase-like protein